MLNDSTQKNKSPFWNFLDKITWNVITEWDNILAKIKKSVSETAQKIKNILDWTESKDIKKQIQTINNNNSYLLDEDLLDNSIIDFTKDWKVWYNRDFLEFFINKKLEKIGLSSLKITQENGKILYDWLAIEIYDHLNSISDNKMPTDEIWNIIYSEKNIESILNKKLKQNWFPSIKITQENGIFLFDWLDLNFLLNSNDENSKELGIFISNTLDSIKKQNLSNIVNESMNLIKKVEIYRQILERTNIYKKYKLSDKLKGVAWNRIKSKEDTLEIESVIADLIWEQNLELIKNNQIDPEFIKNLWLDKKNKTQNIKPSECYQINNKNTALNITVSENNSSLIIIDELDESWNYRIITNYSLFKSSKWKQWVLFLKKWETQKINNILWDEATVSNNLSITSHKNKLFISSVWLNLSINTIVWDPINLNKVEEDDLNQPSFVMGNYNWDRGAFIRNLRALWVNKDSWLKNKLISIWNSIFNKAQNWFNILNDIKKINSKSQKNWWEIIRIMWSDDYDVIKLLFRNSLSSHEKLKNGWKIDWVSELFYFSWAHELIDREYYNELFWLDSIKKTHSKLIEIVQNRFDYIIEAYNKGETPKSFMEKIKIALNKWNLENWQKHNLKIDDFIIDQIFLELNKKLPEITKIKKQISLLWESSILRKELMWKVDINMIIKTTIEECTADFLRTKLKPFLDQNDLYLKLRHSEEFVETTIKNMRNNKDWKLILEALWNGFLCKRVWEILYTDVPITSKMVSIIKKYWINWLNEIYQNWVNDRLNSKDILFITNPWILENALLIKKQSNDINRAILYFERNILKAKIDESKIEQVKNIFKVFMEDQNKIKFVFRIKKLYLWEHFEEISSAFLEWNDDNISQNDIKYLQSLWITKNIHWWKVKSKKNIVNNWFTFCNVNAQNIWFLKTDKWEIN